MAEHQTAKMKRPEVGEPFDARFSVTIMIGTKCVYTSGNVEHGKEGWAIIVDDELDCVWVGYGQTNDVSGKDWTRLKSWTRMGWDSTCYVRYRRPDGSLSGELKK